MSHGADVVLGKVTELAATPGWTRHAMTKGALTRVRHQSKKPIVIET